MPNEESSSQYETILATKDPVPGEKTSLAKTKQLTPGSRESKAADHMQDVIRALFDERTMQLDALTPVRFVRYLQEFNRPFFPHDVLGELFDGPSADGIHGLIIQNGIPFRMVCEHHLLPALGKAYVGYVPSGKVVGLSKIARLVDAVGTSRPGMQEIFTEEIADMLDSYLKPKGVMCVIHSTHSCMACRGVNVPDVPTTTSCIRGVFRDVPSARTEFLSLIGGLNR